jgi:hypothetical protein
LKTLQSKPNSPHTLYLNNWGGTLSNSIWNDEYNGGEDIHYTPYSNDNDTAKFSREEKEIIWLVWREVAEDYAIFNVNVTTSQAVYDATPASKRSQIIATQTSNFYPNDAGGVAYVGSFDNFTDYSKTGFNWVETIDMGMAYSHESGHQMGLSHYGTSSKGYYDGHGEWGPIMGAPYGQKYVQWSRGEYTNANQTQDDLAIISRVLGVLDDDAGDSTSTSTSLVFPSTKHEGQISPGGIKDDIDVYSFTVSSRKIVNVSVESSLLAESQYQGGNLAFDVVLTNSSGVVIAQSTSSDIRPLSTRTNKFQYSGTLNAGNYFLSINGVSPNTNSATGFVEYGNGGQYILTIEDPNALSDIDGDGIPDVVDNCPIDKNSNQLNTDGSSDGGDVCDSDDDNDGYSDTIENNEGSNPLNSRDTPNDLDNDFIPDSTDNDIDGDGVTNDKDGIIDVIDSDVLNPFIGDSLPPVFVAMQALAIEATANLTPLTLVEPEVTDNNRYPVTLSSDYRGPLNIGTHNILWTAIDYANNRTRETQVVHIVDTTAPVINDLAIVTINASGITTDISSKIDINAIDLVDGEISFTVEQLRLKSGKHRVPVSAKDSSGNLAQG